MVSESQILQTITGGGGGRRPDPDHRRIFGRSGRSVRRGSQGTLVSGHTGRRGHDGGTGSVPVGRTDL